MRREIRFIISGAIATLVSYVTFPFFYIEIFPNSYYSAYGLSTFLNITISFVMQKYFVFRSPNSLLLEYVRFVASATVLVIIGYLALGYLIFNMHIHPALGNFIVVTVTAISSYLVHTLVTFRSNHGNKN